MRKSLGMLSFLFLFAMTLVGCSDNRCCDNNAPACCTQPYADQYGSPVYDGQSYGPVYGDTYQPVYPQPRLNQGRPACPPPCEPLCKPICQPCHPNTAELNCMDYIIVKARNQKMCMLGDQYPLDFDVHACVDVCDVTVTTHLPETVSFVKSEPAAVVEGKKLTWNLGPMKKGECRPARVWLKCECEGPVCACFCATATPVRFCALLCAKPILTCEKCGPEQVCPGEPVNYRIVVTNRGSCNAEDVVVTDNLPMEVEHSSCLRTLVYKLGCLAPCESKTINICTTAVKRGNACNTVNVTACNADSVSCQWCTCICCCDVTLTKNGPKEVAIGKNADYEIVATNTGDLPLTEVVVTDTAPSATSIVAAPGAQVNGNQAVWRLREMKPGEKATFNISLTTCTPGCFTDRVNLTNCQGCNACAEATTRWRGRPALNVCVVDSEGAICIGEHTVYTINVVNQGTEADNNVTVVLRFPNELVPESASGDSRGTVSGQTVTFEPVSNVRPRQTLTYKVNAKAKASGDARVRVEVSSDSIKTPIVQQDSTIVN